MGEPFRPHTPAPLPPSRWAPIRAFLATQPGQIAAGAAVLAIILAFAIGRISAPTETVAVPGPTVTVTVRAAAGGGPSGANQPPAAQPTGPAATSRATTPPGRPAPGSPTDLSALKPL